MRIYLDRNRAAAGLAVAALASSCLGLTFSAARKNGQGGEFYRKADYESALKKYSEAMTEAPEKPQLYFNIGDVLYRQSRFPEAVKLYEKSAAPGDPSLQSKSWYNIGNAKYREAVKAPDGKGPEAKGADPKALKEAAACYIKSLESDPDDMDAKYNLEFVQREIRKLEEQKKKDQQKDQEDKEREKKDQEEKKDQQKEQQKDQQKEQERKEQEQKEQEKKEQEKKEQEKKEQQQKEQEQKDKEQNEQKKEDQQGQQQKDQQKEQERKEQEKKEQEKKEQEKKEQEKKEAGQAKQEEQPAGAPSPEQKNEQSEEGLSEQQARQLIESLERDERDPTHLIQVEGSSRSRDVDKDW